MNKGLLIVSVEENSIASELGLEAGDRLLAINGHGMRDIIDFGFFGGDEELLLEVEKVGGDIWEIELEHDAGTSLGLRFSAPRPKRCKNRCIFCFVDQLPKGLRRSLYVKDEDYRLSFLYGNFVTLTSLRRDDLKRILQQRLSPLYISVHATDERVRGPMLGNRGSVPIYDQLRELADAGITMHTQVVLCPGVNDGPHFEKTVRDLASLFPRVSSLAVVPLGLTKHRMSLPSLCPVTRDYAARFVSRWQSGMAELAEELGAPFLFLADEFFIKAGLPLPSLDAYGDLPQIENGVGMLPLFLAEVEDVLGSAEHLGNANVTVITGVSPYPHVSEFLERLQEKTGVSFRLNAVVNSLFGDSVTVTGLVSGRDIVECLKKAGHDDLVMLPDVMLKEGEGIFIDSMSLQDLRRETGADIVTFDSTPTGFYEALVRLVARC
jgi:putative radical SAM enzyme (TIGR03279 family)